MMLTETKSIEGNNVFTFSKSVFLWGWLSFWPVKNVRGQIPTEQKMFRISVTLAIQQKGTG